MAPPAGHGGHGRPTQTAARQRSNRWPSCLVYLQPMGSCVAVQWHSSNGTPAKTRHFHPPPPSMSLGRLPLVTRQPMTCRLQEVFLLSRYATRCRRRVLAAWQDASARCAHGRTVVAQVLIALTSSKPPMMWHRLPAGTIACALRAFLATCSRHAQIIACTAAGCGLQ